MRNREVLQGFGCCRDSGCVQMLLEVSPALPDELHFTVYTRYYVLTTKVLLG